MLCALLSLLLPESYNERRELGAELSAGSIMQLIVQVNPCDPDNHDHYLFIQFFSIFHKSSRHW